MNSTEQSTEYPNPVMAESTATAPKPSSSVKLVLLGEAAVGKVRHVPLEMQRRNTTQGHGQEANTYHWGPTSTPVISRASFCQQWFSRK